MASHPRGQLPLGISSGKGLGRHPSAKASHPKGNMPHTGGSILIPTCFRHVSTRKCPSPRLQLALTFSGQPPQRASYYWVALGRVSEGIQDVICRGYPVTIIAKYCNLDLILAFLESQLVLVTVFIAHPGLPWSGVGLLAGFSKRVKNSADLPY